jgi:hypothetical protein
MNGMQMSPPPVGDILGAIVVIGGVLATLWAFILAFRATLWPGEEAGDHPKYSIFKEDR